MNINKRSYRSMMAYSVEQLTPGIKEGMNSSP